MKTVLGVARQRHTLATGQIVSKARAARQGMQTFPNRWAPIPGEALRLRESGAGACAYGSRLHRRRDVLDFMDWAADG